MRNILAYITALTLLLTIAACQSSEPTTVTNTPEATATIEATATPTPKPTATPEPTLPPEIAKLPITMHTMTDELPEGYGFIVEEQKLIIHHQFGDVTYEGVTKAGTNEWGYTVFYFEKNQQECWVVNDLELEIIDHSDKGCISAQNMAILPIYSTLEAELAWRAKNRDISAIMIVLDELNVSWNKNCTINFSDELKEYMHNCEASYAPEELEDFKEEIAYIAKIFNGPQQYKGQYPSLEGYSLYSNTAFIVGTESYVGATRYRDKVRAAYPDYNTMYAKISATSEYLLVNTNFEDNYKFYNKFREASQLMKSYFINPSLETYSNLQNTLWADDVSVAPIIILAAGVDQYQQQKEASADENSNIYKVKEHLKEISSNFNKAPQPAFTTPVSEYTDG